MEVVISIDCYISKDYVRPQNRMKKKNATVVNKISREKLHKTEVLTFQQSTSEYLKIVPGISRMKICGCYFDSYSQYFTKIIITSTKNLNNTKFLGSKTGIRNSKQAAIAEFFIYLEPKDKKYIWELCDMQILYTSVLEYTSTIS